MGLVFRYILDAMGMTRLPWLKRLAALSSLEDASRRQLFAYVRSAGGPVGRDQAAEAMDMPRSTASFHLDRLVRDGVLLVLFKKTGKGGPGSGRPAKFYLPAMDEVAASVPERHYDLAGDLMASAIDASSKGAGPVRETLLDAARRKGLGLGRPGDLPGALNDLGYTPEQDENGGYRLLNCPFHRLSSDHRDVVCSMNGALLRGAAEASGVPEQCVVPDSGPGHCCARITGELPGQPT